jgi:hypothetical protein
MSGKPWDEFAYVPAPRGLLEYATSRFYITARGSGTSPQIDAPTMVTGVRQGSRTIYVEGVGWIAQSRVKGHYRRKVAS